MRLSRLLLPLLLLLATSGCNTAAMAGDLAIHAIQGAGASSPWKDSTVSFTGIATSSFTAANQLKGFHVQTPDAESDGDSLTSEGIFVYTGNTSVAVAPGDSVRVTGKVSEYNGMTEITGPTVTVLAKDRPLPAAVPLILPFPAAGWAERWEGMRVRFPQTLVVTGNYGLGRYGEFVVAPRRILAPTQAAAPGEPARQAARRDSLSLLVVNDAASGQNPSTVPYPTGGLAADNTLRAGSRVDSLEGILDFAQGLWTLQPTRAPVFQASPRPAVPARPANSLRVASFNVLNYFTTVGTAKKCGPARSLECRGASDTAEFRRQRTKILSALTRLDADVVGLMEIENHPTDSALADLVAGLNAPTGSGTVWAAVPTGTLGGDAIKVALIYRTTRVELVDTAVRLTSRIDPEFLDTLNRVPLAQTFADRRTGERFTVVVNHLKSKGSACGDDPDRGDGQGNCNRVRTRAASALAHWVKSRPTGTASPHALLLGDYNAYAREDPLAALRDSGFANLSLRDEGDSSHSYQFGNAFGTLDHAFATPDLASRSHARHWAINADEPVILDYNLEYKSAAQKTSYYAPDPYASSDHDPVVVDICFGTTGLRKARPPVPGATRPENPRRLRVDGRTPGASPAPSHLSTTIIVDDRPGITLR